MTNNRYNIGVVPLSKTVLVQTSGELHAELLRTIILEAIGLGLESKTYKRIFDFTEVTNLPQAMKELVESFKPETLQFITNAKIAVVISPTMTTNEDLLKWFRIYVSTAVSEYRMFDDRKKAEAWLATV